MPSKNSVFAVFFPIIEFIMYKENALKIIKHQYHAQ